MTLTRYTQHWFCCEHSCKGTPNNFPIFAVDFRVWSEKDETKKKLYGCTVFTKSELQIPHVRPTCYYL